MERIETVSRTGAQQFPEEVNAFYAMSLRDTRRQLLRIEQAIADLMDATMEAPQDQRAILATLELRLRNLRMRMMRLESN